MAKCQSLRKFFKNKGNLLSLSFKVEENMRESYLTEQFHQITCFFAEQFCKITHYLVEQFCQIVHYLAEHLNKIYLNLTLSGMGGPFRPPCRKIAISPEPNLCWTSYQSVNLSLSVVVQ